MAPSPRARWGSLPSTCSHHTAKLGQNAPLDKGLSENQTLKLTSRRCVNHLDPSHDPSQTSQKSSVPHAAKFTCTLGGVSGTTNADALRMSVLEELIITQVWKHFVHRHPTHCHMLWLGLSGLWTCSAAAHTLGAHISNICSVDDSLLDSFSWYCIWQPPTVPKNDYDY